MTWDNQARFALEPPPILDLDVELPAVVLSDLHLAHPANYLKDPAELIPVLGKAKTAIFNGDTSELLNVARRPEASAAYRRLIEVCEEHRIRPLFLTGNHDPFASSAHYLDVHGTKVFLTHGDALHPWVAPWSAEGPQMWSERSRLLVGHPPPATLHDELLLVKRSAMVAACYQPQLRNKLIARLEMLSRFALKPSRVFLTFDYWANVAHFSHELKRAHRPAAKLMLIGHTHRAGVWQAKDYTLVNTGSFQPLSFPLAVHLFEKEALVYRLKQTGGAYRLGRVIHHINLM